jgi:hypothetical protein
MMAVLRVETSSLARYPKRTYRVQGDINVRRIITPPVFIESSCENIVESRREHCITSTNYWCHLDSVEVCLRRLQELEKLSRVSCYFRFGTPEYSPCHKLKSLSVIKIG